MDRRDLTFTAGQDECAAWLYPAAETGKAPVVVMAHGLSGTRRDRLAPFAERFSRAGFAALVFDHRGFGESGGEPDLFDPARQLEDWRHVLETRRAWLRRRGIPYFHIVPPNAHSVYPEYLPDDVVPVADRLLRFPIAA